MGNFAEQESGIAHLKGVWTPCDVSRELLSKRQESLVRRLKAGNRPAAAELVDAYYEQIYLFMRRLGHSRQVSEDLTQESFLQAWQHIGQLRSPKALSSWLYHIASNASKLYWRRNKHDNAVDIDVFDLQADGESDSEKIERLEQLGQLKNALSKLPIKLRETIVLHYMQHLTIAQAARVAGIREGTFKSRLSRALKALRKQLIKG